MEEELADAGVKYVPSVSDPMLLLPCEIPSGGLRCASVRERSTRKRVLTQERKGREEKKMGNQELGAEAWWYGG